MSNGGRVISDERSWGLAPWLKRGEGNRVKKITPFHGSIIAALERAYRG
jgi:hypothetical protein